MYILFLFKAQTMSEEVLWIKVLCCLKWCTHGKCHSENLSLSSTHVHIAPSLWLLMWIDLFVVLQAIASLCLKYRKQISLCMCVCVYMGGWRGAGGATTPTPFRPLIRGWCCLKCHCWPSPLPFIWSAMSQATCNPLLPDAAKVGKIINFTATCCILTLTMPYFLASSCGWFLIKLSYFSPSPRLTQSVALSTFTVFTLTVMRHKSAFWVKLTHYCTIPSSQLPAEGVGNINSSLGIRQGQNGQPDLLLLLLLLRVLLLVVVGGGHGGDRVGVDSPADFPYNLQDRKPGDQSQKSGLGKMRLVHVDKNCDMWNFATEEHLKLDNCSQPKFQPAKEDKRGVVVAQSLQCVNCSFVTPLLKLSMRRYTNHDKDEVLLFRT